MSEFDESVLTHAEEYVRKLGLPSIPQPRVPQPISEVDIDSLTNAQLAALYSHHISFSLFVKYRLTQAEVAYRGAKASLEDARVLLRRRFKAEGLSEAAMADAVENDDDFRLAQQDVLHAFAIRDMLQTYTDNYTSQARALSRLMSLRQMDLEQTRTSRRGAPGRPPTTAFKHVPVADPDDDL